MTSLMCSTDRQKVETLKTKLFRLGIPAEIHSDPLASKAGRALFEIFVDERDLLRASKVRRDLDALVGADDAAGSVGGGWKVSDLIKSIERERRTGAEGLLSSAAEPPTGESPGCGLETGGAKPEGEFAQATALLEKEVEELLVAQSKLAGHCSALEGKVKSLGESLAQAKADLAREESSHSDVERRLTEVCNARALLEKEMQALEVRLQASEQTLAASQAQVESQSLEYSVQQAAIANLKQEVSSRDAQLGSIAESLAQARAGIEQERELRHAAEHNSSSLEKARESLECQLVQQAQQQKQLVNERRGEQEQMRVCVGKVNDLSSRVRAMLAARDSQ